MKEPSPLDQDAAPVKLLQLSAFRIFKDNLKNGGDLAERLLGQGLLKEIGRMATENKFSDA